MISKRLGQLIGFFSALVGRLILAAGTALLVMGVGAMILGPVAPSDGLNDSLLPSNPPVALGSTPPIIATFPPLTPTPGPTTTPKGGKPTPTPKGGKPTPTPSPTPQSHAVTRIVLAKANVDLPVMEARPNEKFPYCDVAERLAYYSVPGNNSVTYLYAHARPYMFGGLLVASWRPNAYLIGTLVQVYTSDNRVYTYEITEIHRHQPYTSFAVADSLTGETLVLQTCEDASGVGPKLIIVARPVKVSTASQNAAHPDANPRSCS